MDKEVFADVEARAWWLLESDDRAIDEQRRRLGDLLGRSEGEFWYTVRVAMEELYDELERTHNDLLRLLDELPDDDTRRLDWLNELAQRLQPEEAAEAEAPHQEAGAESESEPAEEEAGYSAAAWNEGWGMLYRAAPDGSFQYAFSDDQVTIRPGTNWMEQDQALAARDGAGTAGGGAESEGVASEVEEGYSEAAWDDGWGMLYRAAPDGTFQYAHSDDRVTIRPGTQWMSQEEATAGRAGEPAEQGAADESAQPAGSEPAAEVQEAAAAVSEEVLSTVSSLLEDLANDGENAVDEAAIQEALQTPEFEEMIRQAAANLSEELAGVQASSEGETEEP